MHAAGRSRYLSTELAAQALGVSVSTVKRWVDEGVLPAHRTAGGHRKILRAEVAALARSGELPGRDLTLVDNALQGRRGINLKAAAERLWRAMRDGDGDEVNGVIRRVYSSGVGMDAMADRVISPSMALLGDDWRRKRIDVWQEHRGTQLLAAALFVLRDDLVALTEKNRPIAIGGAPEGDPYVLPTLLAQFVLLDAGWNAINLGPNTPLASLANAVKELKPRLVWLSVSHLVDAEKFIDQYRKFHNLAEKHGVAVALGGRDLPASIRAIGLDASNGDRLKHLSVLARKIHPRPKPPRRGRPRKS